MSEQNLRIVIDALFRGKGEVDDASRKIKGLEKDTKGAGDASEKGQKQMSAMAMAMKTAVVGAALSAGYAMVQFAKNSVTAASAVEEMRSKFNIVFGEEANRAEQALSDFGRSVGRSTSELMGMASTIQDTFVPMGFARDQATDMSVQMVKLATDLSSFNNMSMDDALQRLQGTLVGAHRNALSFGVIINENVISQELMRMGASNLTGDLLEQAKVQARLNLLIAGTTDAQGDAERTAGSYANQMRALNAAKGDLSETIGALLLPKMTELVTKQVEYVRQLEEGVKYLSGDYHQAMENSTKEIVEQASSMDDLIKSGQGLNRVYNEMSFLERMIGSSMVRTSIEELAGGMAAASESVEDFQSAIGQTFTGQTLANYRTMLSFIGMTEKEFYNAARAASRYANALEEAEYFDRKFTQSQGELAEALGEIQYAFIDASSEAAELMGMYDPWIVEMARAQDAVRAQEEAVEEATEANRIAAEAIENLTRKHSGLFMEALNVNRGIGLYLPALDEAGDQTEEFALSNARLGLEFMKVAEQGGLTMEQIAILGGAYGLYTGEALEAAIKTALIRAKMEELIEKVKAGDMSVHGLKRAMQEYIAELDNIPDEVTTDITANIHVNYPAGPLPINVPGVTLPEGTQLYSHGGRVSGGRRGRDSVPALLEPDEIVLPVSATSDMGAAVDFLSKHIPGGGGGGVTIEAGAIVINAGSGMNEYTIAQQVIERINSEIGRRADNRMRA